MCWWIEIDVAPRVVINYEDECPVIRKFSHSRWTISSKRLGRCVKRSAVSALTNQRVGPKNVISVPNCLIKQPSIILHHNPLTTFFMWFFVNWQKHTSFLSLRPSLSITPIFSGSHINMKHNTIQGRNMQPPILTTLISRNVFVVHSRISRNHFTSEKYNTLKSFKQHFPQQSPLVQIYISASDCKGVGNIPGNQFVWAFSALLSQA